MAFKVRFQFSIAVTILVIIVALTAAIASSLYLVSSRVAEETAGQLFSAVADGLYERIDNQMGWTLGLPRAASEPVPLAAHLAGSAERGAARLKCKTFIFLY